ncbi:MAG TPA: late competence development ComFB family protein [Candidatus Obscuribacterales bacterium]
MTGQDNFHEHIEQAIQNVLSKVKTPDREPVPMIKTVRPATRRDSTPVELQPESGLVLVDGPGDEPLAEAQLLVEPLDDDELEAKIEKLEAEIQQLTNVVAEPVYLEAEDLFTPLRDEDLSPEPEEDTTLQEPYSPPYNLFEEFVETELNILLSRYLDLCHCNQCRSDIVALALHQLPAYYVTGTRGTLTAKSVIWTRYMQQIMDAVTKAIHIVYKRPRPNCGKIRQMLWVKPDLEEVSAIQTPEPEGEFFGPIHQEDIEIKFSDEVAELIQTLEQAPADDKAELLPVFSPIVQNAYKQYAEAAEPPPPDDLQLLDIDTWES